MAGIGFELRRLLRHDSFAQMLRGYAYAGLISSGPWVFSIIGVILIGLLSVRSAGAEQVGPFTVSVTYLMATTLIATSPLQLLFTRFASDRVFDERTDRILPNLAGAMALTTLIGGTLAGVTVALTFEGTAIFKLLLVASFVVVADLWLLVVLLSGLKAYRAVVGVFFLGYALSVSAALSFGSAGMTGLLAGFLAGQTWMLAAFGVLVIQRYPSKKALDFSFLRRPFVYGSLSLTGLLYSLGIWVDKFLFWFNPATSRHVLGPLRASFIYDLPMFMAYLSIVPGMAVFLVRVETDFAEQHAAFYEGVRSGATLAELQRLKASMVQAIRQGIYDIFKVQGLTTLMLLLAGPRILKAMGISRLYLPLFNVDLIAVATQVLLLAILNVFYYFDQRRIVLGLSAALFALNLVLTLVTQKLGTQFYGYGFGVAVLAAALIGMATLTRKMERLEYETFMLQ